MSIYTLKQGSKCMGLGLLNKHYIIGFRNATTARNVQYKMCPDMSKTPVFISPSLVDNGEDDQQVPAQARGTLVIPKSSFDGGVWAPMNDGGFHLEKLTYNGFALLPVAMGIGIILSNELVDETDDQFIFKALAIPPQFNSHASRRLLVKAESDGVIYPPCDSEF
jgi:hypothetical protein